MTKRNLLFFFVLFITLFFTLQIFDNNGQKNTFKHSDLEVQLSTESSLAYGEYAYFYSTADDDDKIRWEFSGTNNYVGITVFALTDTEFVKFQNFQTFYRYILSNGSYYRSSGTFYPPSYDIWYVVFLNDDSSIQITYLTYDINIVRGDEGSIESILYPILAVVIIGGVIAAVLEISKKKKLKEEKEIKGQKEKFTNINKFQGSIKYCSQCGSSQKINAVYCVKCGEKFDDLY